MLALTLKFTKGSPFYVNKIVVVAENYDEIEEKLQKEFDSKIDLDYLKGDENILLNVGNTSYECTGSISTLVLL